MTRLTYADALRLGAETLTDAGIEEARYKAKLLLMRAGSISAAGLISESQTLLSPESQNAFESLIARAAKQEPLQHILGETAFFDFTLKTDPRALIPRPDSEIVVELALSLLAKDQKAQVADLGTGTGALLLAILRARPLATGIGVEASSDAASLAAENRSTVLDRPERMALFQGTWSAWQGWGGCELIISNPPYIRSDVIPTLSPDVRDYDPMAALDGGGDGLDAYREIISLAAAEMKSGTILVFEIGYDQKQAVSELLLAAGFGILQHRQDLGGHDRAIAAIKS